MTAPPLPRLRLRLHFGDDLTLGPGKAELLEHIRDAGSISEAGRRMRMSYKRAWMLVEEMNRAFRLPLVESVRGGAKGGGAVLTPEGAEVLAQFRALERLVLESGADRIDTLRQLLKPADQAVASQAND